MRRKDLRDLTRGERWIPRPGSHHVTHGGGTPIALALLLAAAMGAAALACSDDPMGPTRSALERNRARWEAQGIAAYEFEYELRCFCHPDLLRPVVIQVHDGQITAVRLRANGELLAEERYGQYPTVDELFGRVENAIDRGADHISAAYHPELGYPTEVYIDFHETARDDEWGFEASELKPIVSGDG